MLNVRPDFASALYNFFYGTAIMSMGHLQVRFYHWVVFGRKKRKFSFGVSHGWKWLNVNFSFCNPQKVHPPLDDSASQRHHTLKSVGALSFRGVFIKGIYKLK